MAMTFGDFHNGIRLLFSIDSHEIGEPLWWEDFKFDPVGFFIRADNATVRIIWEAMAKRGAVKAGPNLTTAAE